jgi:predicted amidophosphoribosyltransferase
MPTLDLAQLQALQGRPARVCPTCGRAVRPNYCRECDEFFEAGHVAEAVCPDARHDSHRTY